VTKRGRKGTKRAERGGGPFCSFPSFLSELSFLSVSARFFTVLWAEVLLFSARFSSFLLFSARFSSSFLSVSARFSSSGRLRRPLGRVNPG